MKNIETQVADHLADVKRHSPWELGMAEQDAERWAEARSEGDTDLDLTDWLVDRAEKASEDQLWKAGT